MAVTIRPAAHADVELLTDLEQQTYGSEGYPAALFYQALAQWPSSFFVATQQQRVCGYVLAAPGDDQTLWIMSLLIAPSARGHGIGQQLMRYLLDQRCIDTKLALTVAPDNHNAIRLYQRLGFRQAKYIPDFMGPQHDRLLLIYPE